MIPYDGWHQTRRERARVAVMLNPCGPCAAAGKQRTAKNVVRVESGELENVCIAHFIEFGDAFREEGEVIDAS